MFIRRCTIALALAAMPLAAHGYRISLQARHPGTRMEVRIRPLFGAGEEVATLAPGQGLDLAPARSHHVLVKDQFGATAWPGTYHLQVVGPPGTASFQAGFEIATGGDINLKMAASPAALASFQQWCRQSGVILNLLPPTPRPASLPKPRPVRVPSPAAGFTPSFPSPAAASPAPASEAGKTPPVPYRPAPSGFEHKGHSPAPMAWEPLPGAALARSSQVGAHATAGDGKQESAPSKPGQPAFPSPPAWPGAGAPPSASGPGSPAVDAASLLMPPPPPRPPQIPKASAPAEPKTGSYLLRLHPQEPDQAICLTEAPDGARTQLSTLPCLLRDRTRYKLTVPRVTRPAGHRGRLEILSGEHLDRRLAFPEVVWNSNGMVIVRDAAWSRILDACRGRGITFRLTTRLLPHPSGPPAEPGLEAPPQGAASGPAQARPLALRITPRGAGQSVAVVATSISSQETRMLVEPGPQTLRLHPVHGYELMPPEARILPGTGVLSHSAGLEVLSGEGLEQEVIASAELSWDGSGACILGSAEWQGFLKECQVQGIKLYVSVRLAADLGER